MEIFSWLKYDFMKYAFLAVLIITPLFGLMGTWDTWDYDCRA